MTTTPEITWHRRLAGRDLGYLYVQKRDGGQPGHQRMGELQISAERREAETCGGWF